MMYVAWLHGYFLGFLVTPINLPKLIWLEDPDCRLYFLSGYFNKRFF